MSACVFLQTATCVYTGWFLAVGLAVFVPVMAAVRPGGWRELVGVARRPRAWLVAGGWAAAVVLFLAPYFVANRGVTREYADSVAGLPTVHSWLTGAEGSRWSETLRPVLPVVYFECRLFGGFALYALLLAAAVTTWKAVRDPARRPEVAVVAALLLTAAFWWVMTLRFGADVSGWSVVRRFPGGAAIRCVARVYVLVYLFAGLGAVVWLEAAVRGVRRGWVRGVVLAAVCGAVVYEQTGHEPPSFRASEFYPVADRVAAGLAGADAGYVLPRYGPIPGTHGEVLAMWAGLKADVPVVNGYSGRWPDGFPVGYEFSDEMLRAWLGGRFRGRVAVIDPDHSDAVRYVVID